MTGIGNSLDTLVRAQLGPSGRTYRREDIDRYQAERLRETLLWARERSPFYRARLGSAMPDRTEDIRLLPFTTAADLAADPARFVCVSQSEISRVVTLETSGTTGKPKRLFFTADDRKITFDYFRHGLSSMVAPGDTALVLLPRGNPGSLGGLLDAALHRLGARALFADGTETVLERHRPALVIGAPVPVLSLARRASSSGGFPRRALLCADHIPKGIVRFLEEARNCEVFHDWGMTEMGYGGGVDCHAHAGYHLQEGDFLFEIVDPESGVPLPEGESGEVVLTTLTRRGMPLIRYRTGDVSRFIPGPCACGSPLKRLGRIATRNAGRIPLGDGEITQGALDEALFASAEVADFKASFRPGTPHRLRVEVLSPDIHGEAANERGLARRLDALLEGIPSLHRARTAGRLHVDIAITMDPSPFGRGKRIVRMEPPQ